MGRSRSQLAGPTMANPSRLLLFLFFFFSSICFLVWAGTSPTHARRGLIISPLTPCMQNDIFVLHAGRGEDEGEEEGERVLHSVGEALL